MNNIFKVGLAVMTSISVATVSSVMTHSTDIQYLGDVNDDGVVNSVDALAILKYSVKADGVQLNIEKADMNGDGTVNSVDALKVLRTSVGIDEKIEYKPSTPEKSPLDFDKTEIIEYYNASLKKAYASEKVTINKKTEISVKLDKLKPEYLLSTANGLIDDMTKPTNETKTFNSNAKDAEKFLVPTALEPAGAKDVKIVKEGNFYKISITLVRETVNYKTMPKYNSQASLPIAGIANAAQKYNVTVNSSNLDYSGTILTALIDESGNIITLNHTMPLKVDAKAKYGLMNIEGSGSGQYTLNASFAY